MACPDCDDTGFVFRDGAFVACLREHPPMRSPLAELAERCPKAHEHTLMPTDPSERLRWIARMTRTHRAVVHHDCGLPVIWVPQLTNDH